MIGKLQNRKKVGLALGSGSARGLAHVGVIKSLIKHHIPIDYLAGTSIGAWVAVYFALHKDIEEVEAKMVGFKKEKLRAFFEPTLRGGFIKGKKIEKLFYEWFGNVHFNQLLIPTTVVATDLISGKEVDIDSGLVVPAVRASVSIPAVFQPVQIGKHLLVDGAITNAVPDDVAKRMGADVVIAVNLDKHFIHQEFKTDRLLLRKTVTRSLDILRYHLTEHSTKTAHIMIEPKIDLYWFSGWKQYFQENTSQHMVDIGEQTMDEYIPEVKRLLE
ncbi:MAG TPA: patatin-like phospholipase family protein [Patescibacteria group bacterium]|nr:patatin-like phospholipase family protein [Patescibacteria group bacterium]